jgi:hypothetical protein
VAFCLFTTDHKVAPQTGRAAAFSVSLKSRMEKRAAFMKAQKDRKKANSASGVHLL